jgi:hypothetical protein
MYYHNRLCLEPCHHDWHSEVSSPRLNISVWSQEVLRWVVSTSCRGNGRMAPHAARIHSHGLIAPSVSLSCYLNWNLNFFANNCNLNFLVHKGLVTVVWLVYLRCCSGPLRFGRSWLISFFNHQRNNHTVKPACIVIDHFPASFSDSFF